jgi:hypothetical protein
VNPNEDPVAEMLAVYDRIIADYLRSDLELLVATGLTQVPYDRVKYYYRIKNHKQFLTMLGIRFIDVLPRMTRDFLVEFESAEACADAERILSTLRIESDDQALFGELDNRGSSLFITLSYPHEITHVTRVIGPNLDFALQEHVVFVAIKNGMHSAKGFVCSTDGLCKNVSEDQAHVKSIYQKILQHFGVQTAA